MTKSRRKRSYSKKNNYPSGTIILSLIFLAVIVVNVYYLWQGEENLRLLFNLQKESETLQTAILNLEKENKELKGLIQKLRTDPSIIEEEARARLNLIKEGEELFVLPEKERGTNQ